MRIAAMVTLCTVSLLANPIMVPEDDMGLLRIWPTARSTALGGAATGLGDEADAAYFNPAGLAFQTTAKADVTHANWLPGLYLGMYYEHAAGGAPLRLHFLHGRQAYVAGSLTYMAVGETDVVNERGDFLGRINVWRGAAAAHAGLELPDGLAVGLGLKLVRSSYYESWSWCSPCSDGPLTAASLLGVNAAVTVAADLAVLYRPVSRISIGVAVVDIGPRLIYRPNGRPVDLPTMARLGLCWTPVEDRDVRVRVMPELDKPLVGMFRDTTGRRPLGSMLGEEWRDVQKALGVEVTAFRMVSLRLGYFEDLTNQLGGMVLKNNDGLTYHYGLWDAMTRKGLGQLKSIGLCWGLGIGTNKLRFDFSSDAAIYDFSTRNWKMQLTCNDVGRLLGRRG